MPVNLSPSDLGSEVSYRTLGTVRISERQIDDSFAHRIVDRIHRPSVHRQFLYTIFLQARRGLFALRFRLP